MDNWLIFDADDVLLNFRDALTASMKKINPLAPSWEKWDSYNHPLIYGFASQKEFRGFMYEHKVLENTFLDKEAINVLHNLKAEGFKIGVLTARGWHPDALSVTSNAFNSSGVHVDKIIISGVFSDLKSSCIKEFDGRVISFIDDNVHHVEDVATIIENSYLLSRPWNKTSVYSKRVDSLDEYINLVL